MFFFKNRQNFELQLFHEYNIRTLNVNYPIHRLTVTENKPCYMCLKLFNHLPSNYKTILKKYLRNVLGNF